MQINYVQIVFLKSSKYSEYFENTIVVRWKRSEYLNLYYSNICSEYLKKKKSINQVWWNVHSKIIYSFHENKT